MRPKLKPLAQQVIVVTGASRGIGLVTTRLAARRSAKVMALARNERALRDRVEAAGGGLALAALLSGRFAQPSGRRSQRARITDGASVTITAPRVPQPLPSHA